MLKNTTDTMLKADNTKKWINAPEYNTGVAILLIFFIFG